MAYHRSLPYERDNQANGYNSQYLPQNQQGLNYSYGHSRSRSRSGYTPNDYGADDGSSRPRSRRFRGPSMVQPGFAHKRQCGRNFSARFSRDLSPNMSVGDNGSNNCSGFTGREHTHSGFYRSQSRDGISKRRSCSPIRTPPRYNDGSYDINQRISIVGSGNDINKRLSNTDHGRDVNGRYSNMDSSCDINKRLSNTNHDDNINHRLSNASHDDSINDRLSKVSQWSDSYNRSHSSTTLVEKQSRSFGDAQLQSKSPDAWEARSTKYNRSSSPDQTVYPRDDELDIQLPGNTACGKYVRTRYHTDHSQDKISYCGIPEQMSAHFHETRPGEYRKNITVTPAKFIKRSIMVKMWHTCPIDRSSIFSYVSKYGDIGNTVNKSGKKQCCYFSYYDSRSADKFFRETRGKVIIDGTEVKFKLMWPHYHTHFNHPHPLDFQATVLFSLKDASKGFEESDYAYFEIFGDIYQFYPYRGNPNEWIVNFYDTRAAQDAMMFCHGQPFNGGTIYTTSIWGDVVVGSETACPLNYGRVRHSRIEYASVEQPLPVTTSKIEYVDSRKSVEMPPLTTRISNSEFTDVVPNPACNPNFNVETRSSQETLQRNLDVQSQNKPSVSVIDQPLSSESAVSVSANQRLQNEMSQSQAASTNLMSVAQNMPLYAPTADSIESRVSQELCTTSEQTTEQTFKAEPQSPPPASSAAVSAPNAAAETAPDGEYSEGISRLLGILAKVQKTSF